MTNDIAKDIIKISIPREHQPEKLFKNITDEIQNNLSKGYITPSPNMESFSLNMKIDIDGYGLKEYTITLDDIDGQTDKLESIISKCIFDNYNEMGI
jgi:hypothetical protein